MKHVFLDTETTGLEAERGHRIVEVVAIAYENRRQDGEFHSFCNPERAIDAQAQKVHGITPAFLQDKPVFSTIAEELAEFLRGNEIIIHNAEFDCAFLDAEFKLCKMKPVRDLCKITCSLELARRRVTGLRHYRLEDLCRHFGVDDSARVTHNARLDAQLLAGVYYAMMREQMPMTMRYENPVANVAAVPVIAAEVSDAERAVHEKYLDVMESENKVKPIWRR